MRFARGVAVAALIVVALLIAFSVQRARWTQPASVHTQDSASMRKRPVLGPQPQSDTIERAGSDHDDATLPASLRETEIDGWLGVDDDGHLVVTPGARWFFDYFLSATGEESMEDIRARIVAEIERRLPAAGADEAIALLDRYLAYRERVRRAGADDGGDLGARLSALHTMRVEVFGESDAVILFGEEEQAQRADLQRRAVMSDTTLSPEEREQQLQEIEQQLPAEIRAARADTFAPVHLMQDEQSLRAAGASADDIHALRVQRFGNEAADRLAALDREQAAWQERLADYQRARRALEADHSLDATARTQALEKLLTQRFTPQERLRVDGLQPIQ